LLLELPYKRPHRTRVRVSLVGSLSGCAYFKEDERTNEFVTPLHLIRDVRLQIGKVPREFHGDRFLAG
jgi:hypothetical protein